MRSYSSQTKSIKTNCNLVPAFFLATKQESVLDLSNLNLLYKNFLRLYTGPQMPKICLLLIKSFHRITLFGHMQINRNVTLYCKVSEYHPKRKLIVLKPK